MDKPITVARQDFMESLVQLINNSGLPAFMIADIFELTLPSLRTQAQQQYENDKSSYEKEGD